MIRLRAILAVLLSGCAFGVVFVECTPAQVIEAKKDAIALERGTCLVLRLVTGDGVVREICASADALATFVAEAIDTAPEAPPGKVAAAITIKAPRKPAKRHCAKWDYVDAGASGSNGSDGAP